MTDPNWKNAMEEELLSMKENNVWDLTLLPQRKVIVGGKWHYIIKRNTEGEISRYKARYVAKGYSQVRGRDCEETYCPTVKLTTLSALIAFAAYNSIKLKQMDLDGFLRLDMPFLYP